MCGDLSLCHGIEVRFGAVNCERRNARL